MKKLILHVGLEKTGTSFLQQVFHLNKELLSSRGILYPKTGLEGSHHYWLAKGLGFHFQNEELDPLRLNGVVDQFFHEVSSSNSEKILVSSEHFDFNLSKKLCSNLREVLKDFEVCVILFLRNQIDYAQSLYMEHLKWGGVESFREFLDFSNKFNFYEKVRMWKDSGFDVRVSDYDRSKKDILSEFLTSANLDINSDEFITPNVGVNVSPPIDFLELVRQLNVTKKKKIRRKKYLSLHNKLLQSEVMQDLFKKRAWGYPSGARKIVEHWRDTNNNLVNFLGENPSNFLGGDLFEKYSRLSEFAPPNISEYILKCDSFELFTDE
ncbi:hypothetical protein ACJJIU_01540 [Microbulbifer sp. CnH-101-E]|uniref:hypothetical protein n=1 Tax=unclassified Microbulbifer TaxID=2619833 RepID=UPI004039F1A7